MIKSLSDWVSDQIVEFSRPIAHRIADDITDQIEVVVTVKVRTKDRDGKTRPRGVETPERTPTRL